MPDLLSSSTFSTFILWYINTRFNICCIIHMDSLKPQYSISMVAPGTAFYHNDSADEGLFIGRDF